MTADQPKSPTSPKSSRSPRSPSKSLSVGSQYARAFQYHPMTDSSPSSSPSSSQTALSPKPAGPRSPVSTRSAKSDRHDHSEPGSSRTRFYTTPLPATLSTSPTSTVRAEPSSVPNFRSDSPEIATDIELDPPHAPYRPPEAVIEPPEEHPPGYTPGIVAEYIGSDDEAMPIDSPTSKDRASLNTLGDEMTGNVDAWKVNLQNYNMDVDATGDVSDRPQIGPGVLPRRWLMIAHEHELVQPSIDKLPQPSKKPPVPPRPVSAASTSAPQPSLSTAAPLPPSPAPSHRSSASIPSVPGVEHISNLDDVWDALPGQRRDHNEWYFCATCWGWIRIKLGRGELGWLSNMVAWEASVRSSGLYATEEEFEKARAARHEEWRALNDLQTSRMMAEEEHHHLHQFSTLVEPQTAERLDRVSVDDKMNAFPHITFGVDVDPSWTQFTMPKSDARLFLSCSSDLWILVDEGVVPGQIPVALARSFTDEKMNNPGPGWSGPQSVNEAWSLIATLLINPLFKGQRGWVALNNNTYQKKIGAGLTSSNILYQIGFACQQEPEGLRVGPFKVGGGDESALEDKQKMMQMDQYMIRAWVEVTLHLLAYQKRNSILPIGSPWIQAVPLEEAIADVVEFHRYPKGATPYPDTARSACYTLGATKSDRATTIETAYGLQISCDIRNTPRYLAALEQVAQAPTPGKEALQLRVATERSLDKYSSDDIDRAYQTIGYTSQHVEVIGVDAPEAPDDYVLDLHKRAVQTATSTQEKQDLARALVLLGRERNSDLMKRLGGSGQALISVDEAYAALSAPRDAVDDGLIMQYEMAVNEYPGKADHYKLCLSIIADAPGEQRPGLQTFLQTGSREPDVPARLDIPVGLQNIGYLNSILQYLYSIKPLRDAVLSFEQTDSAHATQQKPDVERAKRFVRQLRLLFLQLYKSEQSSVRPDEELAYLAITRPEVDAIVEPQSENPAVVTGPTFDSIPDIPDVPDISSPSSTRVASPETSPPLFASDPPLVDDEPSSPSRSRSTSILGKRASEDRDDSSRSSEDRVRVRADGVEHIDKADTPMDIDDYEVIQPLSQHEDENEAPPANVGSPSAATEIGHLDLKSPVQETDEPKYDAPSVPPPLPPRPPLMKKDTLSSGLRFGLQQDSAEVLINVLSQLELALDEPCAETGGDSSNLIQSLFSCKFRQQIIYESPSSSMSATPSEDPDIERPAQSLQETAYEAQTSVESVFTHPIIGVEEEGKDLYDCLAELYLKGADIEYEGKKGYMMDLMDDFPPMLYIQMRRSQYDPTTGRERKTNTHIGFQQTLSMGRYLTSADGKKREEAIELTREMVKVRTRLHQLRNHKPMSIPQTFRHASTALRQLAESEQNDPDLSQQLTADFVSALETEAEQVDLEIASLQDSLPRLREKMDKLWQSDIDDWEYELVSVFMHRGKSSGSGHYWTYQAFLPDHSDTFFKYNDETVTQVPASEVLQDRTGDDANPALLCYVRKGRSLVDTLHREVLEKAEVQEQGEQVVWGGSTEQGLEVTVEDV
ncbi:hypothetical protein IAR55_001529 [Kwoniella newhampshirensis]|uniref:ubiquitinyl hydrolase 1 n=1 Tax=Kwoniella newhampshirensis TaxID=1651941 RepID=A0AAW0Z2G3_9TREE